MVPLTPKRLVEVTLYCSGVIASAVLLEFCLDRVAGFQGHGGVTDTWVDRISLTSTIIAIASLIVAASANRLLARGLVRPAGLIRRLRKAAC